MSLLKIKLPVSIKSDITFELHNPLTKDIPKNILNEELAAATKCNNKLIDFMDNPAIFPFLLNTKFVNIYREI